MRQYVWKRAATVGTAALPVVGGTGGAAEAEDVEAPEAPVVTSTEYPDDGNWHDGAGSYRTYVLDSASEDVVEYRYAWLGNGDLLLDGDGDGDGDHATTATALTPTDAGFSAAVHVRLPENPPGGDNFLAVVHDEATDQLRLYVGDEYPADTASVAGVDSWAPTGDLQIGRTRTGDGCTDHLAGEIDEIHTYAGVVSRTPLVFLAAGGTDA
ncbi:hypothetical protein M2161_005827 [Streptomyces sp. SAI-133]|uniref:hypothetical protein n=1 Tax=unclassified Streptomyces TaxID=2593676 RepID=UPI002473F940|nr:hypothetical protein [Streptomyces sp. SAI-133]MDH6586721.1 hypothetical protein [Streptomyces sp. SAI-133]